MSSILSVSNPSSTLATSDDNQNFRPTGDSEDTPQKNVRPAELTWAEAQSAFIADLKEQGKESQEKNFRTTFKFFLKAIGKTENSLVGDELTEEFEAKLKVYVDFQIERRNKEETYGPRVSKMRLVKQFVEQKFASRLALQTLPKS